MDTATPTPGLWATPTPWPTTNATPQLSLGNAGEDMAYELVAGYQFANNSGALDILSFAIIAFIIIGGVLSIVRKLRNA